MKAMREREAAALDAIAQGFASDETPLGKEVAEALRQRAFRQRYLEEFNRTFGDRP